MLRRFGTSYAVASVWLDALLVGLALALAERWRPEMVWLPLSRPLEAGEMVPLPLYVSTALLWIAVFSLIRLYDPSAVFRIRDELRVLILGSGFATLATAGLLFLSYRETSRWLFLVFAATTFGLLFSWRLAARLAMGALKQPPAPRRVLIVGSGPVGRYVGRMIEAHRWAGLSLAGYLEQAGDAAPGDGPVLGTVADARTAVRAHAVDEVVVALPDGQVPLDALVGDLLDLAVHVRVIPDCFSLALDRPAVEDFAGVPMLDLRAGPLSDYQRFVKRLFDLVLASALALVSAPIMLAVAVAIRLDSPGPVLLRQQRVGENGKVFTMYKFRSMVHGEDDQLPRPPTPGTDGLCGHKRPDDPRVTRLGRFLRRTSLDELPQLFNVLRGEMSLVGPRPELPMLVAQYAGWQRRRLVVPPGMTGWWQVNGRAERPLRLHTDDDLYYIANYSLWLDLRILSKTVGAVVHGRGAY